MVLELILVVLGVVLLVFHGAQGQCSKQLFETDGVRNSVPSQLSRSPKAHIQDFQIRLQDHRRDLVSPTCQNDFMRTLQSPRGGKKSSCRKKL